MAGSLRSSVVQSSRNVDDLQRSMSLDVNTFDDASSALIGAGLHTLAENPESPRKSECGDAEASCSAELPAAPESPTQLPTQRPRRTFASLFPQWAVPARPAGWLTTLQRKANTRHGDRVSGMSQERSSAASSSWSAPATMARHTAQSVTRYNLVVRAHTVSYGRLPAF